MKTDSYWSGFEWAQKNIADRGFEETRNALNEEFPVGQQIIDSYELDRGLGIMDALLVECGYKIN